MAGNPCSSRCLIRSSSCSKRIALSRLTVWQCSGVSIEQVALRAEAGTERHHRPLADRVDRRIGDLGEQLLEIGVKQPRVGREDGERDVVAHGEDGFLGTLDHRREDHVEFLQRNPVGDLLAGKIERGEVDFRHVGVGRDEFPELEAVFVDPAA